MVAEGRLIGRLFVFHVPESIATTASFQCPSRRWRASENYEVSVLLLLIFLLISNAGLTTILIRSEENTKYVMFVAFIKFFVEVSLFGALGHQLEFSVRFGRLYFFLAIQTAMFYLTMKTRKNISPKEEGR